MDAKEMIQALKDGWQFRMIASPKTTLRKAYDGTYELVHTTAFACCAKIASCMGQDDRIYFGNQLCGSISFMITVDQWEVSE